MDLDKLYNVTEVGEYLGMSRPTLDNIMRAGDIECYNIGTEKRKILRIKGQSVFDYLKNNKL